MANNFVVHGHRGARGLFPENTLAAFEYALSHGVKAIEIDVVVSGDKQIVISHEPWMCGLKCKTPNGATIMENDRSNNLYQLDYELIQEYDCGSTFNPSFPNQNLAKSKKPLLKEFLALTENHEDVLLNIEIKSEPDKYGIYQPYPEEFVALVLDELKDAGVKNKIMLQSFDVNILNALYDNETNRSFEIAYLIENKDSFQDNLRKLQFLPDYYNPDYLLVDQTLVNQVHQLGMKIIPWTVNIKDTALELMALGVDGLISDYPVTLFN